MSWFFRQNTSIYPDSYYSPGDNLKQLIWSFSSFDIESDEETITKPVRITTIETDQVVWQRGVPIRIVQKTQGHTDEGTEMV